jgi:hypothetical protein
MSTRDPEQIQKIYALSVRKAPAESGLIHLVSQGARYLAAMNITTPMVVPPSSLAKTKPKSNKNATATREKKEMHKHTNSSHQPPLLNQDLSTSLAKGLGI